jgi:hypothetical protein
VVFCCTEPFVVCRHGVLREMKKIKRLRKKEQFLEQEPRNQCDYEQYDE